MPRGIVIGQVSDANGDALKGADVALSGVRGSDVNGSVIKTNVPVQEVTKGGWFSSTTFKTDRRPTNDLGIFIIPFEWGRSVADDYARAYGQALLTIKVTVLPDDNKPYQTFYGKGVLMLDTPQMLDNIKSANNIAYGDGKEVLKGLLPEMRKAIKGDEFKSIQLSMLSTEQMAIVGLMPGLQIPQ